MVEGSEFIVVLSPKIVSANSGDNDEILKVVAYFFVYIIYMYCWSLQYTPSDGFSFKEGLILTKFVREISQILELSACRSAYKWMMGGLPASLLMKSIRIYLE